MSIRWLRAALVFVSATGWTAIAAAQVETIDPNPTMPRDVGGRLNYRSFSGGGAPLGRTTPNEENPAETLLRSIEGTNYGRATGHSIFSPRERPGAVGNDRRWRGGSAKGSPALYYAERGAYEDRVYHPARGSYRSLERQQTYYRAQPKQAVHRVSPKATPKRGDGHRPTERPRRAE